MAELFTCTITVETLRDAWRTWVGDHAAEPPMDLLAGIPAGFVAAAMEDAALSMLRILLGADSGE